MARPLHTDSNRRICDHADFEVEVRKSWITVVIFAFGLLARSAGQVPSSARSAGHTEWQCKLQDSIFNDIDRAIEYGFLKNFGRT